MIVSIESAMTRLIIGSGDTPVYSTPSGKCSRNRSPELCRPLLWILINGWGRLGPIWETRMFRDKRVKVKDAVKVKQDSVKIFGTVLRKQLE